MNLGRTTSAGTGKLKLRRAPPQLRREALIEATLASLKRHGHEGTSIRKISAEAGVSVGLINHHYPSKSSLIAEAYETLAMSLQASFRQRASMPNASAREKLHGFFEASFAPDLVEPELLKVWLVFWSMVSHEPEMHAVHDRTYRSYRALLESLLRELQRSLDAPPFKLKAAAIGLSALLDGLWVEISLSPTTLRAADAIALCDDWVDALCAGGFARLKS